MTVYLSKSDFKVARSCPTKLYYRMMGYPSLRDGDEYLELLADGGYMVEQLAKLLFPEGREIGFLTDLAGAAEETIAALQAERAVLFEGTLISGGKLARADILVKDGDTLTLIEVKAKSFDSAADEQARARGKLNSFRGANNAIASEWRPYLEDVTFQVGVLRELFPQLKITAFLMMPDKAKTTKSVLFSAFDIREYRDPDSGWARMLADYTGDAALLPEDHFLALVNVDAEVALLRDEVERSAALFIASLDPAPRRLEAPRSHHCKDCEFRSNAVDGRDGFRECWGRLADVTPHLFDLYHLGEICRTDDAPGSTLIRNGTISLFDLKPEQLVNSSGKVGERQRRQRIQLEYTARSEEWFAPELLRLVGAASYPLRFIDFETSALAVPYHPGMRPYETVAFQWSCHTIAEPGAEPEHAFWLNETDSFPNLAFAESLREQLRGPGTVFAWATHERTVLRLIAGQIADSGARQPELERWLLALGDQLVDLNALTLRHYFHPLMKSSTSLKRVVDAIWQTSPAIRRAWIQYVKEADGLILSPYQALPALEISGRPVVVSEGTAAVRAYQALMHGVARQDFSYHEQWKQLLLEYCKLDTLAMVMVWRHWGERASKGD
ncbi:MAG TPA: DUF2779 domain-containing protein [Herpetosiphonaceae bacterium]